MIRAGVGMMHNISIMPIQNEITIDSLWMRIPLSISDKNQDVGDYLHKQQKN